MIWLIWVYWLAFMQVEIFVHWFVINIIKFDLTPDSKWITFSKALVVGARLAVYFLLWWKVGVHDNWHYWMFTIGCFATHMLIFPIQLNWMSGKKLHYLGTGFFDRLLALFPLFAFRVWTFLVISAGMIAGYNGWY